MKRRTYKHRKTNTKTINKRTIRYNRNERKISQAIFELLLDHRGRITMWQVARRAKLSRITVYNHYHCINRAVNEIEEKLLHEFNDMLDGHNEPLASGSPGDNRRVFFSLLLFMSRHKEVFYPLCQNDNTRGLFRHMVEAVFPRLDIFWLPTNQPAPAMSSERVDLYLDMVVCVIRRWGVCSGCDLHNAGHYLNRIIFITGTVSRSKL